MKDPHLCANYDCDKLAVFLEDRGPRYCSNDCVVEHCRYNSTTREVVAIAWPPYDRYSGPSIIRTPGSLISLLDN